MYSRAQYTVLTQKLGIQKVFCVVGFSMGAQQVRPYGSQLGTFTHALDRHTIGRLCTPIL